MNIEELLKQIPERLKLIEEALGLNKTDMSNKMGISRSFYSNIVTGVQLPSFAFLFSLCLNCGVSADWLIFGKGQMFIEDNEFVSKLDGVVIDILKDIYKFSHAKRMKFYEHILTALQLMADEDEQK